VVLPRCLDDATYATLTSLTLFNNVDVLSALQGDARFLPRLFSALKDAQPDAPEWGDLVAFLQELCSLSKHLQLTQRQALWSKMQQLGLFEVLTKVIASGAPAVKLRATDILLSTLGHDPVPLRNFLTGQPGHELLGLLVREMLSAPDDSGLPEQIAELLKVCGRRGGSAGGRGAGGRAWAARRGRQQGRQQVARRGRAA
jgi:protein phosphatase-4 regulatory subunit 3